MKSLLEQVVQSKRHDFSSSKVVPNSKGVYLIYDKAKGLIYAGQSGRLKQRLFHDHLAGNINGSHFRKSLQAYLGTTSEEEISRYIRSQEHEHGRQKGEELDEHTTLVLFIYSEELSSMPPLVKLDGMLDRYEKIVKELR